MSASMPQLQTFYETLNFFMVRMPVLPLQSFRSLQTSDSLLQELRLFAADKRVQEAIAVASPTLLAALDQLDGDANVRKTKQTAASLLRYLLRMSTRPTPFGLFAGVALGTFDAKAQLVMADAAEHQKRSRPDMEWLLAVVDRLEKRLDVVQQLRVQSNQALLQVGQRLLLPYDTYCGQSKTGGQAEVSALQATEAVHQVLQLAREPIPFVRLLQELDKLYPQAGRSTLQGFVWQLVGHEFLLSELRPPLTVESPLQYVREKLQGVAGVEEVRAALGQVEALLAEYDALSLGEGLETYRKLCAQMRELAESDSPVQVDLKLAAVETLTMPKEVAQEAERAAACLWRLSHPVRGLPHMRSYHKAFLERYGTHQEVPVLELLSEDIGLGAPATYVYPKSSRTDLDRPQAVARRETLLGNRILQAIHNREQEVLFTDEWLAQLEPDGPDWKTAPDSLELYAEVIAASPQAAEKGDFWLVLGPNPGTQELGQSFGRFRDLLGAELKTHLQAAYDAQAQLRPHVLFAESVYLPPVGRNANIMIGENLRPYELTIGTNSGSSASPVQLEDLVVGATVERLFLKSRTHGKEVVVTATHLINLGISPNVYRFVREVSQETVRHWLPFALVTTDAFPYLPRLRYGRTILAPAQWRLDPLVLGLVENPAEEEAWQTAFAAWRTGWAVPRYIYMTHADHRILLDLDNREHVAELRSELFKQQSVKLLERVGDESMRLAHSLDGGTYMTECVFPLLKKRTAPMPRPLSLHSRPLVAAKDRKRLPGSDWLYVKLYGTKGREDEWIAQKIAPFAADLLQKGLADSWFFMRYRDPDPHIRLRLHGDPSTLVGQLLPLLHDFADEQIALGFLKRLTIETYEREVERYGGVEAIDWAERVFAEDSATTAKWLAARRSGQLAWPPHVLAAFSILDLMSHFGFDVARQLEWLERRVRKQEFLDEFRAWRKKLLSWIDPSDGGKALQQEPYGEQLQLDLKKRGAVLANYREQLERCQEADKLSEPLDEILGSLLHLHCNRLLGTNRSLERKALAFARHALYSQKQRLASKDV